MRKINFKELENRKMEINHNILKPIVFLVILLVILIFQIKKDKDNKAFSKGIISQMILTRIYIILFGGIIAMIIAIILSIVKD